MTTPGKTEGLPTPPQGGLRPARLARRLALLALLLAVGEMLPAALLPTARYARDYRPTWPETARFIAYLNDYHRRHPDRPIILFLGPSTAWGTGASPGHAIPEEFGRLLAARYHTGPLARAQVFNLCLEGSNSAMDYYLLRAARSLHPTAVYYQEHYRFFGARAALELKPELVASLGLWPSAGDRERLGGEWMQAERSLAVEASLACHRWWTLYRDRFALRALVYGDPRAPGEVGQERYDEWLERTGREHRRDAAWRLEEAERLALINHALTRPWDTLPAAQRELLVRLNRNLHSYNFGVIRPSNRNLGFIGRLLAELKRDDIPTFAYTAVLNRPLLREYGLVNEADFARNSETLRRFHAERGVPYVDYNTQPPLPAAWFHDVDHLVDAGTAWQARRLLDDSRGFLEAAAAQPEAER